MKRERTICACFNRETRQSEPQLSELHLKAESDEDVEILEMLNELLEQHEAKPERVAAVRSLLSERIDAGLDKMAYQLRMADAAPNN